MLIFQPFPGSGEWRRSCYQKGMFDVRHSFGLLLVTAPLFGCSGGDSEGSQSKCGDDRSRCMPEPIALCDGSSSLVFAANVGGGNIGGLPRVVTEAGWSFLLVDGSCHYWTMTEPDGPIRTSARPVPTSLAVHV